MLYKKVGYIEVGIIPSLYREGITEYLMIKLRDNKIFLLGHICNILCRNIVGKK